MAVTKVEEQDRLLEDAPGLHEITQLRREPKDFSVREIKREIRRGEQIQTCTTLPKSLLPHLEISHESVKYYASLVGYYSVYKLKQFDESTTHVYLLRFVYHRYQRVHDHLMSSLIHHVRRYREAAKGVAKDRVYAYRSEGNEDLEMAFQWEHMDELAHQFKRHLRPILLAVDWTASAEHTALIEAVAFLKDAFQKGRLLSQYPPAAFPLRFIPDTAKRYLSAHDANGQRHMLPDRYEFLVYHLLRNGLEAGDVFCRDSVRFRSFEDDLLDDNRWKAKEKLIAHTGLPLLKQPIREHLAELETRRALWEYDNIIRSLYLLDYIDSPPLRRNVRQALNGAIERKLR